MRPDTALPIVIIGRASNLSRRMATALPGARLVSAREVVRSGLLPHVPDGPYQLVLNAFQPAVALTDLSDPVGYVDRAIGVTARALADLSATHCVKVVYTSSASVYGNGLSCRESGPVCASSLHAGLKIANEALVQGVCAPAAIDCTVVRIFNMFGGDDSFSVIAKLIGAGRTGSVLSIANGGNAIRDFIHVDDVVRCYRAILHTPDLPVVNVASGVGVSVRNVIDALRLHGLVIRTTSVARAEIQISSADVSLLGKLIDPAAFTAVIDFVLSELDTDLVPIP